MAFTFFFRDNHSLTAAADLLLSKIEGLREVKIWDAGCAMGPEPYSFAILLAERMGYFAFKKIKIHATDIDESGSFSDIVSEGIYPENELCRIPRDIFIKYFSSSKKQGYFRLNESIRSRVVFHRHNLLSLKPIDTGYNMVICKNVLLHFTTVQRANVINMYHTVLKDGGILLTERTQTLPESNEKSFRKIAPDVNVYEKVVESEYNFGRTDYGCN